MKANKNRGITLIALVITIIVMLILAGVTINLVLDDKNGIIKRSDISKEAYVDQAQREAINLAYTAAKFEVLTDATKQSKPVEEISIDLFTDCLKENSNEIDVEEDGYDFLVYFLKTGFLYTVAKDGKIVSSINNAAMPEALNPENYNVENGILTGFTSNGLALYNGGSLYRIVVPDTVTTINDNAFKNYTELKKLIMSDTITSIGDMTFYNCTNLNYVVVSSKLSNIRCSCF